MLFAVCKEVNFANLKKMIFQICVRLSFECMYKCVHVLLTLRCVWELVDSSKSQNTRGKQIQCLLFCEILIFLEFPKLKHLKINVLNGSIIRCFWSSHLYGWGLLAHNWPAWRHTRLRILTGWDSCGSDWACPWPTGNAGAAHDTDPTRSETDANAAEKSHAG